MWPTGLMSLAGSVCIVTAFFLPMVNTGSVFNDVLPDDLDFIDTALTLEADSVPEENRAQFVAGREVLAATGIEHYREEIASAQTDEQRERAVASHALSTVDIARGIWIVNARSDALMLDRRERTVFLWILLGLVWIGLMTAVPGILSLLRRIQPLNAFQVSWNGTYGLFLLVGSLLLLMMSNRFEYVTSIRVQYVQAPTAMFFIAGAALIWLSAYAGLNRSTWWKAPLIGVFLLAFTAGSLIISSRVILG